MIVVQLQWILGAITTATVYYSFVPVSLYGVITFVLLIVILAPVMYMIHSTQADLFISDILTLPTIRNIPVDTKNIRAITILHRVSIASFSILFLPVGILISLYYFGSLSDLDDPFRNYLVGLIGFQSLVLSFICANLLSKILSKNTENVKEALAELKNGNLAYRMPLVDSEELGFVLALNFNSLSENIFEVIHHLKATSNKLNLLSQNLELNATHVATEAENQSNYVRELLLVWKNFKQQSPKQNKTQKSRSGYPKIAPWH